MLVHGFFYFYCWPSVIALFPFQSPGTWMVQTWATQHSGWEWLWARLWLQFWVLLSTELLPDWNNWQAGKAFPPQPDAPSIKTKPLWPDAEPPQLELDKVHVILLFFFNTLKASRTLSISLPFPSSDLFSTLKSVDHITPAASWWSYYSPCCRAQLFPPYIVRPG